uniref:Uncharacterized protein n=1 Tax=Polysiphonia scopulorum TaxID=257860 RepID=A0A1Z1MHE0_9FLOR|nr:hypothetical protein [Polysiphonia scopulorum]ARW65497.1 hypothetical protein [Polysiphonia scopulorum]
MLLPFGPDKLNETYYYMIVPSLTRIITLDAKSSN